MSRYPARPAPTLIQASMGPAWGSMGSTGQHMAAHSTCTARQKKHERGTPHLPSRGRIHGTISRSPAGSVVGTRRFAACSGVIAASPQASSSTLSEHLQHANTQTTCLGTDTPSLPPPLPPFPSPYSRLNLKCEEHRKGRKAAYTSYFIISVSGLSF